MPPLRSAVCRAKRHLRPVRRAVAAGQPLLSAVRRRCAVNRGGWTLALLLGAMALWTLLAWGVAGVLAWLPALAEAAGKASLPVNGALSLVPQASSVMGAALFEGFLPL